jgi:hypothetical protein
MATTTLAYRDALEGVGIRYAAILASAREDTSLAGAASVFAARTGRIYAGTTGIVGAALMVASAVASGLWYVFPHARLGAVSFPTVTTFVLGSWPAMAVAYRVGRVVGAHRIRDAATPRQTGDLHADLARLEHDLPGAVTRRRTAPLERASVALPMFAVALLAPLTLHRLVYSLVAHDGDFESWARMSLVIVGHAHLVLAALCWQFAYKAFQAPVERIRAEGRRAAWRALGITIGVSALPGAVLLLIPPILTAVTGIAFIPLLFWGMSRILVSERSRLA